MKFDNNNFLTFSLKYILSVNENVAPWKINIHPVHRVQSQTSDFIFMLLSFVVIGLVLEENNNASVTEIVHLKVRDKRFIDHGNSLHKHVWVMLLKKNKT